MTQNPHLDATNDPDLCRVCGQEIDSALDHVEDPDGTAQVCQDCLTCIHCEVAIGGPSDRESPIREIYQTRKRGIAYTCPSCYEPTEAELLRSAGMAPDAWEGGFADNH